MYSITYDCGGRLGNCVFPFFVCILFEMRFGYKYTDEELPNAMTITDKDFLQFFSEEAFLENRIVLPPCDLRLWGFFQHDWIFKYFRKHLMNYLLQNPRNLSIMAKSLQYRMSSNDLLLDSLPSINPGLNDIVIHLRLEDNLVTSIDPNGVKFIFSPDDYDPILRSIQYDTIYWVMKTPEHPLEQKYIDYLLKKWGGIYKPRTLQEDISLLRKAHRIVCSRSTLSWISSYLSPHEEQIVYLPLKKVDWFFEQCPGIYPKTTIFDYKKCTIQDLEEILNEPLE